METKPQTDKIKQRGFVMTGGGAKGLYEAGVIHALHLAGMEFDVITGSSIGALNSVFFAEYLYRKYQLPAEVRRDPLRAIEALDSLVQAYQHAWLQLPDRKLIDDSETGPLGKFKDDLLRFKLDLPQVVRLGWWWTDPEHGKIPPPQVWPSLMSLGVELIERLGGTRELLRILKENRAAPVREAARTYLRRFGIDRSLVPAEQDLLLSNVFTQPISPLRLDHLLGPVSASDPPGVEHLVLVDPGRSLRDYRQAGITVRLTRANYRTGRLEISAWIQPEDFVRFLKKQVWKLEAFGPDKLPLGNFRLQVPGNPNAINAALCSGRFPGVFAPYRIQELYPASDADNQLLYKLLAHWLDDPEVAARIREARRAIDGQASEEQIDRDLCNWSDREAIGDFFPQTGDTYVDGGAIDNTPTSTAVDFVREQAEQKHLSRRNVVLDLIVIFLDPEPKVDSEKAQEPALFEVVARTLAVQGAAKKTSDANVIGTINAYGRHGEELGRVLQALLESYRDTLSDLDPSKAEAAVDALRQRVHSLMVHDLSGVADSGDAKAVLDRIDGWCRKMIDEGLPLHVNVIKIYPQKMPLDTLQFTERLGYRKEGAIQLLTMGCYDTLTALRRNLEEQKPQDLDAQDQKVLGLVRKWMGDADWPAEKMEQEKFCQEWRCGREACVFQAGFCARRAGRPVS